MASRASLLLLALAACGKPAGPAPAMPPRPADRTVKVEGCRVHYRDVGRGPHTLVFVHGWSCRIESWRFQVDALAKSFRVVAVDLPGHGRSDAPAIEYTQDLFARAVEAVLRDAGVAKAVLIGHSNGGIVVRRFYRLWPAKVEALVIVDGMLKPWWSSPGQVDEFAARIDDEQGLASFIGGMSSMASPELRDEILRTMTATPAHVRTSAMKSTADPELWTEEPIAAPMLVIAASASYGTADYEATLKRLAPGATYAAIDGVDHFLMMEKPDDFNARLKAFVEGL